MIPFYNGPPPSKLGFVAKQEMPPYINVLFRARPPLNYAEPCFNKGRRTKYDFVHDGNHDLESIFEEGPPPDRICQETPQERKERLWKEKVIEHYLKIKDQRRKYNPNKDKNAKSDPSKTLFVGRLNYKTDEDTLTREMERFGPINSLRLVRNPKTGKSRGYAFVEFKHQRHCDRAYDASGIKIDDKRVLIDYEQSRTDDDWLPKRLGGGKGNKRRDKSAERKIRKVIKEYREQKDKEKQKSAKTKHHESKHNDTNGKVNDKKDGKDNGKSKDVEMAVENSKEQKANQQEEVKQPVNQDVAMVDQHQSSKSNKDTTIYTTGKHKRSDDKIESYDNAIKRVKVSEDEELIKQQPVKANNLAVEKEPIVNELLSKVKTETIQPSIKVDPKAESQAPEPLKQSPPKKVDENIPPTVKVDIENQKTVEQKLESEVQKPTTIEVKTDSKNKDKVMEVEKDPIKDQPKDKDYDRKYHKRR